MQTETKPEVWALSDMDKNDELVLEKENRYKVCVSKNAPATDDDVQKQNDVEVQKQEDAELQERMDSVSATPNPRPRCKKERDLCFHGLSTLACPMSCYALACAHEIVLPD